MTADSGQERAPARLMLARLVLEDGPTPKGVRFHDDICALDFDTIVEAIEWGKRHDADISRGPYVSGNRRFSGVGMITWHGWSVLIQAVEPVEAPPLPAEMVDELAALVDAADVRAPRAGQPQPAAEATHGVVLGETKFVEAPGEVGTSC